MIEPTTVIVSNSRNCDISLDVHRLSVTARTRQKLNTLLGDRAYSKTALADYCGKAPSWLSSFLHPNPNRTERPSFHMDELDDIAAYFRISIGELVGETKIGDLTGDEQRVLYAFRVLLPRTQDAVLALLEDAAVAQKYLLPQARMRIRVQRPAGLESHGASVVPATLQPAGEDTATELSRLRAWLSAIAVQISAAATGGAPDRPLPETGTGETRRRRLAD
jgi:hypothetical protein